MRLRPPTLFSLRLGLVGLFILIVVAFAFPPASAISFPVGTAIQVNTATGAQLYPGMFSGSCTYLNYFYSYWTDGTSAFVASSLDGINWNPPVNILTLTGIGVPNTTSQPVNNVFHVTCSSNVVIIEWSTNNAGTTQNTLTNYIKYSVGSMSAGTVLMGAIVTGPLTSNGFVMHNAEGAGLGGALDCLDYIQGVVVYCVLQAAGTTSVQVNNVNIVNTSSVAPGTWDRLASNGRTVMVYDPSTCKYGIGGTILGAFSATFVTTITAFCTTSAISAAITAIPGGSYFVPTQKTGTGEYMNQIDNGGALVGSPVLYTSTALGIGSVGVTTSDGGSNLVIVACSGTGCITSYSSNSGTSWSAVNTFTLTGANFCSGGCMMDTENTFSSTLEAFVVQSATTGSPFIIYETPFGIPLSTVSSSPGQTIGSCPVKNTATFTMVNQTLYMYEGSTLANEAVNTAQVNIASVGGSTGTHTIQIVIYATNGAGPISPSNLFTLVFSKQVALTSGTKNVQIIVSTSGVNFPTAGAIWGVGVVGDNKIALNQSSLGGAFSFSGVPVSTAAQNSFYTAQGAAFGTDLALCANAVFQSVITQTVTVTQSATTSVTVTSTSTVNTINAQVLFASNQNWPIIFLLLFLPCGILLGATRNLSGGMVGLLIGSIICLMAGVIPAYIFTGLLIGLVAMMVLIQRSGPNG